MFQEAEGGLWAGCCALFLWRRHVLSNYRTESSVIDCLVLCKTEKQQERKRHSHWLSKWLDQRLQEKSKLGEHLQLVGIPGVISLEQRVFWEIIPSSPNTSLPLFF